MPFVAPAASRGNDRRTRRRSWYRNGADAPPAYQLRRWTTINRAQRHLTGPEAVRADSISSARSAGHGLPRTDEQARRLFQLTMEEANPKSAVQIAGLFRAACTDGRARLRVSCDGTCATDPGDDLRARAPRRRSPRWCRRARRSGEVDRADARPSARRRPPRRGARGEAAAFGRGRADAAPRPSSRGSIRTRDRRGLAAHLLPRGSERRAGAFTDAARVPPLIMNRGEFFCRHPHGVPVLPGRSPLRATRRQPRAYDDLRSGRMLADLPALKQARSTRAQQVAAASLVAQRVVHFGGRVLSLARTEIRIPARWR